MKELSLSGHTHEASDISGLSNITTGSFTNYDYGKYTINTQFTPNVAIWFSSGDLSWASRHIDYYSALAKSNTSTDVRMNEYSSSGMFGSNYIKLTVSTKVTYTYIIFG